MNNPRRGRGRSGRRPNVPTRSQNFDSNGPEGRVRGNAQQVYEKYSALARDAQVAGDRVLAEAFQQHGEHYFRVMNDSTDPDSRPREQQGQQSRDDRDESDDDDRDQRGDQRHDQRNGQRGEQRGDQRNDQRGDQRNEQRGDQRNDERGERRGPERGFERRDDRRDEDSRQDAQPGNRTDGRQPERSAQPADAGAAEGRAAPQARDQAAPQARDQAAPQARDQDGRSPEVQDGEARESRLRDRFNRRNGEGILTRRRGEEPREAEDSPRRDPGARDAGGHEEEADAGLRKMLGEAPPAPAGGAEPTAEGSEAGAVKPRRRRRTKAEIEADKAKLTE